jgi:non-ribosomal peptide synthetase component F
LPEGDPGLPIGPDDLALIIHTSGAGGTPRGVADTHRNLLHTARKFTNCHRLTPADRVACLNACVFSNSLKDIYGALLNGGALVPLDVERQGLGGLAAWLAHTEVTVLSVVTAVFRHFVGSLTGREVFPRLRVVRVGGEAVIRQDVESFRRHFGPHCQFVNGYGTTETGSVRCYLVDHATAVTDSLVPVGHPVEDTEVVILGEDGQPVGPGRVGQIAVRSRFLAPGYWRRPDLTALAFRPDPRGEAASS